jgi:hypothetical protein
VHVEVCLLSVALLSVMPGQVKDPYNEIVMSKDYEGPLRCLILSFGSYFSLGPIRVQHSCLWRALHLPAHQLQALVWRRDRRMFMIPSFCGHGFQRVHLDLRVGEASNDYDLIAKKEHLSAVCYCICLTAWLSVVQVETRLYQLLAQAKQIANEQAYQRVCHFRAAVRGITLCRHARLPSAS